MPLMPASPIKGPQKSLAFTDPTGRSLAFLRTYSGQKSLQSVPEVGSQAYVRARLPVGQEMRKDVWHPWITVTIKVLYYPRHNLSGGRADYFMVPDCTFL